MAVAAAERIDTTFVFTSDPLVYVIPNRAEDELIRRRAAHFIGRVAAGVWLEDGDDRERAATTEAQNPVASLFDALRLAYGGDTQGYDKVRADVSSDYVERAIKSGHVTESRQSVDESGVVIQFGQTDESIQANSLRYASDHPKIRLRSEAETRNMFRRRNAYHEGLLGEYYEVVFSRAADDMSIDEMVEANFFVNTMSCSFQATTLEDDSNTVLVTESAFVSGVLHPENGPSSHDDRHDAATIQNMLHNLGVEDVDVSATALLDTPLLIHKSLMPNGVIDLVKMYDDAAGGTFFGEARPRQDYLAYRRKCAKREASFRPTIDKITHQLIADTPHIHTRLQACERLDRISERCLTHAAVIDVSIDPRVLGKTASAHVMSARHFYMVGDYRRADQETRRAVSTARSGSCPSSKRGGSGLDTFSGGGSEAEQKHDDEDQYGSLTFSCPKGHVNRRPCGKLIENCQRCGISVRC